MNLYASGGEILDLYPAPSRSFFESDRGGPGSGSSLEIELSHSDIEVLKKGFFGSRSGLERVS